MDRYQQQHLVRGVTHWIAWMTDEQVSGLAKDGWEILKTCETVLVKNRDGVLVPTDSLSLR